MPEKPQLLEMPNKPTLLLVAKTEQDPKPLTVAKWL